MKISNSDGFTAGDFGKADLPELHGHVKVRVWNPKTHKTDFEYEGENIVTDVVKELLGANYLGCVNYSSLLPLTDVWFGGCLLYHDAFSTVTIDGNVVPDPTDYYPQGDDANTLIAHAGDTAPATPTIIQQDLKRGSPTDVVKTGSSVKRQWQWLPSQGNGVINSVALTHKDVGNAGLGNTSSAFANLQPFASIGSLPNVYIGLKSANSLYIQYDDNHGLWFCIGQDSDYTYRNTLKTSGTTRITIVLRRLPYSKTGLIETLSADSNFPITVSLETSVTFYNQPSYYFDYDNKKLWLFTNIKYGGRDHDPRYMNYTVIDLSDLDNVTEDTSGTIENTDYQTYKLAPSCMEKPANSYNPSVAINANIIKQGDVVFLPLSNNYDWSTATYTRDYFNILGFQKINISTSEQESIIFGGSAQSQLRPYMAGGGLLVGSGYVCNGGVGYPCAEQFGDQGWNASPNAINWATHAFNEPQRPSSCLVRIGGCSGTTNESPRYIYANKFVHTTKFNLPSQVEKTGVQAMTVEYTLTEQ